jgi:hypothetical protein
VFWSVRKHSWARDRRRRPRGSGALEKVGPGRELALAYSMLATVYENAEDAEPARVWATRAIELAEELDETEIVVQALATLGAVEFALGEEAGWETIERTARSRGSPDSKSRSPGE